MANEIKGLIYGKAISLLMGKLFEATRQNTAPETQIEMVWDILKEVQNKLNQNMRDEKVDLDNWGF